MRFALGIIVTAILMAVPVTQAEAQHHKERHHKIRHVASPGSNTGSASWYGKEHQGKRMSNGQPFDRFKLTAASRTVPLGTKIKVVNNHTGLSTVVTITDRGPWAKGRILDLSEAAAKEIGCNGICRVEYHLERD